MSRDWVSGIEQQRFRVGSPTFFSNPNINIPGVSSGDGVIDDDLEGLSCSDDDDDDLDFGFDSGGSDGLDFSGASRGKSKAADAEETLEDGVCKYKTTTTYTIMTNSIYSPQVRIEFRGNQAEAIEDIEAEKKRLDRLHKDREDERIMVQNFEWNKVTVDKEGNVEFNKSLEESIKLMVKAITATKKIFVLSH
jgi:hypothetical protein